MLRLVALLMLAACGRVGFEGLTSDGPDGSTPVDGPSACAGLLCDPFEDPSLAAWPGTFGRGGAPPEHDPTFGRTGGSLRASAPATTTDMGRYTDVFGTATELWMRMWLYVPSGFMLDLEPIEFTEPGRAYQIVFGIYEDALSIHAHNMAEDFESSNTPLLPPRDVWTCYELGVTLGAPGRVALYVDDVLALERTGLDTRPPGGALPRVTIGLPSKSVAVAQQLWFDDVIIATSRSGCD